MIANIIENSSFVKSSLFWSGMMLMDLKYPLFGEYQSTSKSDHKLQKSDITDSRNRKKRRRCVSCYKELTIQFGREEATKRSKKVSTYCNQCTGNPAYCLDCFNKTH